MSVALVGPDGKEYDFDGSAAQLDAAKAQGFRVASEIGAVESALDTAKATALGAAEGFSAGLLGAGLGARQGDEETPESAKARWSNAAEMTRLREESPVASTVGELGGMVLSPLNKVGELVRAPLAGASVASRIGANVAGGMTSGLLFGAGKTVSDAALGDVDLTAEKLLAGAGLGALLGGAGGGLGGAIEEGARAVLPRAVTLAKRAQSALDDIANDATISATRAKQSAIDKLGEKRIADVAKVLRDRGHIELTPKAMRDAAAADREGLGKQLGKYIDDLDAAGSRPAYQQATKRLDDWFDGLNSVEQDTIRGELQSARRGVEQLEAQGGKFRDFDNLKRSIQEKAKFSGAAPVDNQSLRLKRSLAGVFRDELDQQILPLLGSDAGKAFTETKAIYGTLRDAERLAKSGMSRAKPGGIGLGLYDLLAGVAGAGIHPMGLAAAYGSKVLREQGPAIAARIADRLAKEPALQAMAKSFVASLPVTAPKLGPYGAVLAQEAAVSPERALATHMAYAQLDPSYAATAQLAGLTPEQPDEHPVALARAQTLAEAQAAAAAQDEAVKKGVDRVARGGGSPSMGSAFKSQDFGAMRMRRDGAAAYDKRVGEIRELAADPAALIDRISANMTGLGDTAPGVTAAMTATAQRAVAYLAQQSAVPPKAGPMAAEWDPPEADRQAFAEKLEVVQDPMSVLKSAAAGTLTEGEMEALRAVYPRLAQQVADAALERMASGGEVPYIQRLMLSMLSGVDADGSMGSEAIASNQAAIAAAKTAGQPQPSPGDGEITLAERSATSNQKRDMVKAGTQ